MKSNRTRLSTWASILVALGLSACQTPPRAPLVLAPAVDIPRFMGDWYVIANIPSRIERHAYNALESYQLAPDGRILTTFTFNQGGFDGRLRRYNPVGFVKPEGHGAVWGMRFVWPIQADYRVMYVDSEYSQTVVGREKRDYAWIMARTPTLPDSDLQRLTALLSDQGYDVSHLRKVPQQLRTGSPVR